MSSRSLRVEWACLLLLAGVVLPVGSDGFLEGILKVVRLEVLFFFLQVVDHELYYVGGVLIDDFDHHPA